MTNKPHQNRGFTNTPAILVKNFFEHCIEKFSGKKNRIIFDNWLTKHQNERLNKIDHNAFDISLPESKGKLDNMDLAKLENDNKINSKVEIKPAIEEPANDNESKMIPDAPAPDLKPPENNYQKLRQNKIDSLLKKSFSADEIDKKMSKFEGLVNKAQSNNKQKEQETLSKSYNDISRNNR